MFFIFTLLSDPLSELAIPKPKILIFFIPLKLILLKFVLFKFVNFKIKKNIGKCLIFKRLVDICTDIETMLSVVNDYFLFI